MDKQLYGRVGTVGQTYQQAALDVGLRQHMLRVYNFMMLGLVVTGLVAYFVSTDHQLMMTLFATPLKWVVMLAPFAFILVLSFGIQRLSAGTAQLVFWGFCATMGLSMATIFVVFKGPSIAQVFFITSGMFAATSLWGYTTKRDLTGFGSFLFMGLIGLILASLAGMFFHSTQLQFVISVLGVFIFTGLTAYDSQSIKNMYYVGDNGEMVGKKAIMGALRLYLDFINLFLFLLRFMGNRR